LIVGLKRNFELAGFDRPKSVFRVFRAIRSSLQYLYKQKMWKEPYGYIPVSGEGKHFVA
jgi:hypothetical protein